MGLWVEISDVAQAVLIFRFSRRGAFMYLFRNNPIVTLVVGTVLLGGQAGCIEPFENEWRGVGCNEVNVPCQELSPNATLENFDNMPHFGRQLAGGDINGDGLKDVFVSDITEYDDYKGAVHLIYGKPDRFSGTISSFNADARFVGEASRDFAGARMSLAGDVDGDGYDDILVAVLPDPDQDGERVYLIYGQSALFFGEIPISHTDAWFVEDGAHEFGRSITSAGDINGDGHDDILLMSEQNDGRPATYLVYGRTERYTAENSVSEAADAVFLGISSSGDSGYYSMGAPGDLNGDGFDDFLIQAPIGDAEEDDSVSVLCYLFYGKGELFTGEISHSLADATLGGACNLYAYGNRAGDLNGDGYYDLIVQPYGDAEGIHLFYGSPVKFSGSSSLSSADARFIWSDFQGGNITSVGLGGDINGDGYDDLRMTQNFDTTTDIFIFYGKAEKYTGEFTLNEAASQKYESDDFSSILLADIDGDGRDDFILETTWALYVEYGQP